MCNCQIAAEKEEHTYLLLVPTTILQAKDIRPGMHPDGTSSLHFSEQPSTVDSQSSTVDSQSSTITLAVESK